MRKEQRIYTDESPSPIALRSNYHGFLVFFRFFLSLILLFFFIPSFLLVPERTFLTKMTKCYSTRRHEIYTRTQAYTEATLCDIEHKQHQLTFVAVVLVVWL